MPAAELTRYRISFAKTAIIRFTGHLDLHRAWERLLRRARLPLAYTQGFRPHPRLTLASALPLGLTGDQEWVDVWLEQPRAPGEMLAALEAARPPGIEVWQVTMVDLRAPALPTRVRAAEYEAELPESCREQDLRPRVEDLLRAPTLIRQRRGKGYDLRPLIEHLSLVRRDQAPMRLRMILSAREAATGRPEEVLAALGLEPAQARIRRRRLVVSQDPTPQELGPVSAANL